MRLLRPLTVELFARRNFCSRQTVVLRGCPAWPIRGHDMVPGSHVSQASCMGVVYAERLSKISDMRASR